MPLSKFKSAPKFSNTFLDKLAFSANRHDYMRDLRLFGACLSREELAKFTGISEATIRRYESSYGNDAPRSYEMLLRFLSGDLSFFGPNWEESYISPTDGMLRIPYLNYMALFPRDISYEYSTHFARFMNENRTLKGKIAELEEKLARIPSPEARPDNVILFPKAFNAVDKPRHGEHA